MIAYASRTGTKRNLAALRGAGWGLIVSAAGVWRTEGFSLWAADNGQWSERNTPGPFKAERFERFLAWCAGQPVAPQWIVLPDIVNGGRASLALSLHWLRVLRRRVHFARTHFMLAVQNGMDTCEQMLGAIKGVVGPLVSIFVGGDTDWKIATMRFWRKLAHSLGATCHVGRVNSAKRIDICGDAEIDSFDGSSASRFVVTLRPLDRARRNVLIKRSQLDIEDYLRSAA